MEDSAGDGPLYVIFSEKLMQVLQANSLSPADVLRRAGVSDLNSVPDPTHKEGQRDAFTLLLGSAAVVAAATPLIVRVLDLVVNRPVVIKNRELKPALDGNGDAVRDGKGQIVMTWSEASTVDRGPASPKQTTKIVASAKAIEIGIGES